MEAAAQSPDNPLLDERLCLALYTASRAMTARYRPLLAGLDLTYPQYLVMALLWEEGDSTLSAIGARLKLESSTLSPLVRRLEAAGRVERQRNPDDERSVIVALTDQGSALRQRATHVPDAICRATSLSMDQQTALVEELRFITAQLEASAEHEPGSPIAHD